MPFSRRSVGLMAMMIATASAAVALKPVRTPVDPSTRVDYELVIPRTFGNWRVMPAGAAVVNPQAEQELARLYSQIVSRVYQDQVTGKAIMLSLAYGEEQSKQSQVHLPEVCYPAQGFRILNSKAEDLETPVGAIPVKRLEARLGNRNEPITYWIRIGDRLARGGLEQKVMTIREGLAGRVSDGLLVRVSAIDTDRDAAFALQDRFIRELLPVVDPSFRHLLIGRPAAQS